MRLLLVISATALLMIASPLQGDAQVNGGRMGTGKIQSPDEDERTAGRQQVMKERLEVIQSLMDVVRAPGAAADGWLAENSRRNIAIHLLGEYRAMEAVNLLIPLLEPQPGQDASSTHALRLCPAGKALVKIGGPSVPPLFEAFKASGSGRVFLEKQFYLVVFDIDGPERGRARFREAISAEGNPAAKARLEEALKLFETMQM